MKEDLISFKTAKLAKEKGFDECSDTLYRELNDGKHQTINSIHGYDSDINAPTQSLLQRWLREKHNIDVCIYKEKFNTYSASFGFDESTNNELTEDCYKTYEEALEEGLYQALNLIK